jgi:hypothetical protein
MKSRKIANFEITPPKKSAFQIPTPPDVPKQHSLTIFSARRGGGKSVACTAYVKKLLDVGAMQRVMIITPTWNSNKEIWKPLGIKEEDVIEPTKTALKDVVERVEAEKKEYEEYLVKKKRYREFQRVLKSTTCLEAIPMAMMVEALDGGYFEGPPKWKHVDDSHPTFCMLIIDDCMSLPILSHPSAGLVNTCIKHRHIADGLGLSICMLVQSYCAVGGVPRPIRENCTLLCLFKLKDQNQWKKIHEEIGSDVELQKFDQMFEYATSKPFGFLCIDFNPKSPESVFRCCFNEYLN